MKFFNIFDKDSKPKSNTNIFFSSDEKTVDNESKSPVCVFSPTSFREIETIIDTLKDGKNAMVHLTELKEESAIRVLDMLSGAVYALDGGVYELEKNIFMFSPTGVEIK